MPSNYPSPEQLQEELALLQRMARAGYAGIPTGGAMEPQLPAQAPLQTMAQEPGLNPAEQQEQTLRQLGIGPNAGYKSMKAPSIIPLSTVLSNGDSDYNVSAAPLAQGNKFRAINAEVSGPLAGGELALQGGAGRMFGKFKSPTEYEVGLKYTKGFADGGKIDINYGYGPEHLFFDNNRGAPTTKMTNYVPSQQMEQNSVQTQSIAQPVAQPNVNINYTKSPLQTFLEQKNTPAPELNDIVSGYGFDEYGRPLTPAGSVFKYIGAGGGGGGPAGDPNMPFEYFANGGFVDGQSLEEPIDINTQQQINAMMSNGGLASTARPDLASFAKGGDVDVNDFQPPLQQQQPSAMDILKVEFAKRGLDFNKFIASPPVMQQALANAQSMGINGDTMLAHINPKEAKLLKERGGSGDINPNTGLPMFEDGEGGGGDNGDGTGNGTSSSQGEQGPGLGNNDSFGASTNEQGPGLGLNDSFGVSTNEQGPGLGLNDSFGGLSAQGPGLGLNDSFGAQPNAQEQGPGLGLNDSFGGLSAQGPGLGLNDSFGAPTNEQGPGLGLNDTFGANPSVQGPGLGLNDTFGPPSVLGDVEFGIHNYDPVTGVPSVTGIVSTTGQNPSISAALSAISQNATTSQVAAALANAVQAATQTPAATPATTTASTPATTTAAPASPSVAATSTPTAIGTPATKAAQETTLAEDISAAINNAITNALNNPVATAINTGLSLASPPLGLANMVSGLAGYGTLGSGITNAFGGQQSTSKSDVANDLGSGRDSSGGEGGTGGASLAGVPSDTTPTTTSSVLASLASPTTTSNNQFRQFAGNAPNLLNYGYGPAFNYYTYKSAKGGKVSPLKAMRKA